MAVTYRVYTGINTGLDVLNSILAFAQEMGWTVNRDQALSSTAKIITFSRPDTVYYTLQNAISNGLHYFVGNMHKGLATGAAWNAQPDQYYVNSSGVAQLQVVFTVMPAVSIMAFGSNSPKPYMYFAIELAPGHYRHALFGNFITFSEPLESSFMTGSDAPTSTNQVGNSGNVAYPFLYLSNANFRVATNGGMSGRAPSGNDTWWRFAGGQSAARPVAGWDGDDFAENITYINTFDQTTPLITPIIQKYTGGVLYDHGYPPGVRYLNLYNYQPKDEITLGPDVWKVFPIIRKLTPDVNSVSGPENERSSNHAIAYLKS